jgi:UDP-N-acetyl-D-galactosamine dehydrogenase
VSLQPAHLASIKVAEAAKVIENSQRYQHSFVNELAKIFNLMNIDTHAVLAAAAKWNFLPFKPGLVGGTIGVDPYYLAQRAQEFGYHPEIILAGRR